MDYIEYLKAEGFFEGMTPEITRALLDLREGQKSFQLGLDRLSTIAEERGLEASVPADVAMQMMGGLAGRSSHENFLVMRLLLDIVRTLDVRIRAIEDNNPARPPS